MHKTSLQLNFDCKKCGVCCTKLFLNDIYHELDRGDGTCIYFDDKSRLCQIYSSRPIICNVIEFYNVYLSGKIQFDDYLKFNFENCEKLRNEG